jgi:hypothetical protein
MDFLIYAFRKAAKACSPDCDYMPDDIGDATTGSFDIKREIA